jgi:hypothetical protein
LTQGPGDFREIMVQLWYPRADVERAEVASYMPFYGWHPNVRGHSAEDAAVAKTPRALPIVILGPGRGTSRHYYTTVAEDLASRGYAVLGIDAPHSAIVVSPDGRYIAPNPRYKPGAELMSGPYENVDEFFFEAAELGRQDVAFALRHSSTRTEPTARCTAGSTRSASASSATLWEAASPAPPPRRIAGSAPTPPWRECRRGTSGAPGWTRR